MTTYKQFKALHQQDHAFILPNVWNVESARIIENLGFKATATSSAAVANSLGYEDGENIPFEEYLFVIRRIAASIRIPFSVDIETGFGKTPTQIAENIKAVHELGVAGINIEDSVIEDEGRSMAKVSDFAETIRETKKILYSENIEIFMNVRSDVFLLNVPNKLEEAKKRASMYEHAGADGLFFPLIEDKNYIEQLVQHTELPVNVMSTSALPDFDSLDRLGVKRISLADFLYGKVYGRISEITQTVIDDRNCKVLFDN